MLEPDEIIRRAEADRETCEIVAAAGITIEPAPTAPPNRPGYTWIPFQAKTGGPIAWTESDYDPTMPGTTESPIPYTPGMELLPNYFYIYNGVKKVWAGSRGLAPWEDGHFAEF